MNAQKKRIALCSAFFVLGFSLSFAALGILLQTVFSSVDFAGWVAVVGGVIIVLFGLVIMDVFSLPFLQRELKLPIPKSKQSFFASFLFGVAFALGWSPCMGPVLGAIITLASAQPTYATILMLSYSLGIGFPFLLAGLFFDHAQGFIIARRIFGAILVGVGLLMIFNLLHYISLLFPVLETLGGGLFLQPSALFYANVGISFLAGVISFASPCVLPLLPGFLTYLAALASKED